MAITEHLAAWIQQLELTLEVLKGSGAEIDAVFRAGPPGKNLLLDAEYDVGRSIPPSLRSIFAEQVALRGSWRLPEALESSLPRTTRGAVWGGLDLSVREMVAAEKSRQEWVAECFPDADESYDAVWHHKFAFHTVGNGDCIALADGDDGAVYYLSHDDGEGHGVQLAPSLLEFLHRWSRIGFAGPEDWVLMPFVRADAEGIDDRGAEASAWREALGLSELDKR